MYHKPPTDGSDQVEFTVIIKDKDGNNKQESVKINVPKPDDMPVGLIVNGKTARIYYQREADDFRHDAFNAPKDRVTYGVNYQSSEAEGAMGSLFDPSTGKDTSVNFVPPTKNEPWSVYAPIENSGNNETAQPAITSAPKAEDNPSISINPKLSKVTSNHGYIGRRIRNEIDQSIFNWSALLGAKRPVPDMLKLGMYPKTDLQHMSKGWAEFIQNSTLQPKEFDGVEPRQRSQDYCPIPTTKDNKIFIPGQELKDIAHRGHQEFGVIYFVDETQKPEVATSLNGFTTVKAVFNTDTMTIKTPQGDDITLSGDTMVKVGNGQVIAVLDPGLKAMEMREIQLEVLKNGGVEVEDQITGKYEIYAAGTVTPNSDEDKAGILSASGLVDKMADNQTAMVKVTKKINGIDVPVQEMVNGELVDVQRMVILKQPKATRLTNATAISDTIDGFLKNNYLIRWKSKNPDPIAFNEALKEDLDSEWATLDVLTREKANILKNAAEVIQIGKDTTTEGNVIYTTIGRVLNIRGEGFKVTPAGEIDAFLDNNALIVKADGTAEFVDAKQLTGNGNNALQLEALKSAKEIQKVGYLGRDAKGNKMYGTVGRYVKIFNANFELWNTNDLNIKLAQYAQIVTKKDAKGEQTSQFISFASLQNYGTMEAVRRAADEVNIVVNNTNTMKLDTIGHVYIDGSVDGSTVEVDDSADILASGKVYELKGFISRYSSQTIGGPQAIKQVTKAFKDKEHTIMEVTTTDLRDINKTVVVKDVYRLVKNQKPIKLYSERLPQQERIFFDNEGLHEIYSQSMDINAEPGVTIKIGNEIKYNVTGIYDFKPDADNKENGTGLFISLRDIKNNGGYQSIRRSTFDDNGIEKDETGIVKLSVITSKEDMLKTAESANYQFSDQYTYDKTTGEVEKQTVTLTANNVSREGWTIKVEDNRSEADLVRSLVAHPSIAGAFNKYGIDEKTVFVPALTETPTTSTEIYRIPNDSLERKFITVQREGGRVIEIVVGLDFDPRTGEQIKAVKLTPDYQVKADMSTEGSMVAGDLFTDKFRKTFSGAMAKHFQQEQPDLWEVLSGMGISERTSLTVLREQPHLIGADGRYSDQVGVSTYHYLIPNDSRGRDIAVRFENNDLGVNLWWLEGKNVQVINGEAHTFTINVGTMPGSVVEDSKNTLKEVQIYKAPAAEEQKPYRVTLRDRQTNEVIAEVAGGNGKPLTVTFKARDGQPETTVIANDYAVLDAKFKHNVFNTAGGQLLAEQYAHITVQVALSQFGVATSGDETIIYDVRAPFRTPVQAFMTGSTAIPDSKIVKTFADTQYSIQPVQENGQQVNKQKTVMIVYESEGVAPDNVKAQKYQFTGDHLDSKSVNNMFRDWILRWSAWKNVIFIFLGYLIFTFISGKFAEIGRSLVRKFKRSKHENPDSIKFTDHSKDEIESFISEIEQMPAFGFQEGIVKLVKQQLTATLRRQLYGDESIESITVEFFRRFVKVWFVPVMTREVNMGRYGKGSYLNGSEANEALKNIPYNGKGEVIYDPARVTDYLRSMYISELVNRASDKLANTTMVDNFFFYVALQAQPLDPNFGASLVADHSDLWSMMLLAHHVAASVLTKYKTIHHDDLEGYFRTPGFIKWYLTKDASNNNKTGRDLIEEELVRLATLHNKRSMNIAETKEFFGKKYGPFGPIAKPAHVNFDEFAVSKILPKLYPDIKTMKFGFAGWIRVLRNFNWIFTTVISVIIASSFGMMFIHEPSIWNALTNMDKVLPALQDWLPKAIYAFGSLAVFNFFIWSIDKLNEQKMTLKNENYGETVRPEEGYISNKVEGTMGRKIRASFIMATVLGIKFIANFAIMKWVSVGLAILASSSWGVSWGGIMLLVLAAALLISIALLDVYAYFYLVEGYLGHVIAKATGAYRVNAWHHGFLSRLAQNSLYVGVALSFMAVWPAGWAMAKLLTLGTMGAVVTVAAAIVGIFVLNKLFALIDVSKVGGDTVADVFEKAMKHFEDKLLPATKVNPQGKRVALDPRERAIARAKAWNMIVDQYLKDDLLRENEVEALKYKIVGIDANNFLAGRVVGVPDINKIELSNVRVQKRIQFFISTLLMNMERTPIWERMFNMSTLLPHYEEVLIYPFSMHTIGEYDGINSPYKTGHTLLTYFIERYSKEWENFKARLAREISALPAGDEKDAKVRDLEMINALNRGQFLGVYKQGENDYHLNSTEMEREVSLWVSYRYQPLSRSIRGIMNNRSMYQFYAKVNYPTMESLLTNESESEGNIADYTKRQDKGEEKLYEKIIDEKTDEKYEFIVGFQVYGDSLAEKDRNKPRFILREDANYLLKKFPGLKGAYLGTDKEKGFFGATFVYKRGAPALNQEGILTIIKNESGDVIGHVVEISRVYLSSHFFAGQGKPVNQNNLFKFVGGEIAQMLDMNQDFYLEETFKAPNMMEEFRKNNRISIIGYAEDIFTDGSTPVGQVHAYGDHTFVTLVQRVLNFSGIRFHYGHPDFVRVIAFRQLGLLSAPWVNEDIFGAYKATLYGEKVTNIEIMQAAKGREGVYSGLLGISDKFGAGAGEQALSQTLYRLNRSPVIGMARAFNHFVGAIGYFLRKPLVVIQNNFYILTIIFLGLSLFATFPDELVAGLIGLVLSQAITWTGYFQLVLEEGLLKGTIKFMRIFPAAAITYQAAIYGAFSVGVQKAMSNSADYVKTGRRPGRQHETPFKLKLNKEDPEDIYYYVNMKKFSKAISGMILSLMGLILWQSWGSIWSLFPIMMVLSSVAAPFILNPGSTPITVGSGIWLKNQKADTADYFRKIGLRNWLLTTGGIMAVIIAAQGIPFQYIFIAGLGYWLVGWILGLKDSKNLKTVIDFINLYITGSFVMGLLWGIGIASMLVIDPTLQIINKISKNGWSQNILNNRSSSDVNKFLESQIKKQEAVPEPNKILMRFMTRDIISAFAVAVLAFIFGLKTTLIPILGVATVVLFSGMIKLVKAAYKGSIGLISTGKDILYNKVINRKSSQPRDGPAVVIAQQIINNIHNLAPPVVEGNNYVITLSKEEVPSELQAEVAESLKNLIVIKVTKQDGTTSVVPADQIAIRFASVHLDISQEILSGAVRVIILVGNQEKVFNLLTKAKEALDDTSMSLLNSLTHSDVANTGDLKSLGINDIVLAGNDNLKTIERVFNIYNAGIGGRIVVLGGHGRLTGNLIENAVAAGYNAQNSDRSEAEIIIDILKQMAARVPGSRELVTLPESKSRQTRENFENYKEILTNEGSLNKSQPHTFVYIQTPHQQLRTQATVQAVFAQELTKRQIKPISYAAASDRPEMTQDQWSVSLIGEVWRVMIYSVIGHIDPVANIERLAQLANKIYDSSSRELQLRINEESMKLWDSKPVNFDVDNFIQRYQGEDTNKMVKRVLANRSTQSGHTGTTTFSVFPFVPVLGSMINNAAVSGHAISFPHNFWTLFGGMFILIFIFQTWVKPYFYNRAIRASVDVKAGGVTIEPYNRRMMRDVVSIWRFHYFYEANHRFPDMGDYAAMRKILEQRGIYLLWVAVSQNHVIGFIGASRPGYPGGQSRIEAIGVHHGVRGQGVATLLFEHAISELKSLGATNLLVEDESEYGQTGRMALKSGFERQQDHVYYKYFSTAQKDRSRPMPGQPMASVEVAAAELAKHDLTGFIRLGVKDRAVTAAVRIMNAMGEKDKAQHLIAMIEAGHVRAGPIHGFLAAAALVDGQENIILSNNYPAFNTIKERALSLVHEVGATAKFNLAHEINEQRELNAWAWMHAKGFEGSAPRDILDRQLSRLYNRANAYIQAHPKDSFDVIVRNRVLLRYSFDSLMNVGKLDRRITYADVNAVKTVHNDIWILAKNDPELKELMTETQVKAQALNHVYGHFILEIIAADRQFIASVIWSTLIDVDNSLLQKIEDGNLSGTILEDLATLTNNFTLEKVVDPKGKVMFNYAVGFPVKNENYYVNGEQFNQFKIIRILFEAQALHAQLNGIEVWTYSPEMAKRMHEYFGGVQMNQGRIINGRSQGSDAVLMRYSSSVFGLALIDKDGPIDNEILQVMIEERLKENPDLLVLVKTVLPRIDRKIYDRLVIITDATRNMQQDNLSVTKGKLDYVIRLSAPDGAYTGKLTYDEAQKAMIKADQGSRTKLVEERVVLTAAGLSMGLSQ